MREMSIVIMSGTHTLHTMFWMRCREYDMPESRYSRRRLPIICRVAFIAICLLTAPVTTSLPDENRSAVILGLEMRMVMAAKRLRSYVE